MAPSPRVLILGGTGMLGAMLWRRLSGLPGWSVRRTQRRDPSAPDYFDALDPRCDLSALLAGGGGTDFVLNALGMTKPQIDEGSPAALKAAEAVNSKLPFLLADAASREGARLIHISTDGVFSGENGPYDEFASPDPQDAYGKTKLAGEVAGPRALTIRCSIIGPDKENGRGLFEWFRALPKGSKAKGFTDQAWNGVTTLQFAELCRAIIERRAFDRLTAVAGVRHFCPNRPLSKYELLKLFNEVTGSRVSVEPAESGAALNRVLTSRWTDLTELAGGPADAAAAVRAMAGAEPSTPVSNRS